MRKSIQRTLVGAGCAVMLGMSAMAVPATAETVMWSGSAEECEALGGTYLREKGEKNVQVRTCTFTETETRDSDGNAEGWTVEETTVVVGTWDHTEVGAPVVTEETTESEITKCFNKNGQEQKLDNKNCK
jgi:hypothetical protein